MKRVYVAGAYSANNVLDVLKNIGRGEKVAGELFLAGFAPFCPWHDKGYVIQNPNADFTVDMFYQYSISWLMVSDCMFVISPFKHSIGTIKEIAIAEDLGIPIYFDMQTLLEVEK